MNFFNSIRLPAKQKSVGRQMMVTLLILLLGICLGLFSKHLDYRQAELPSFLMAVDAALDFHNFLGGFAPWILLAVCISVYSKTPLRGAINVFVFFVGMVGVLFNTAFVYGMIYFDVTSWLNVLMLGIVLFVLRREKKEMLLMIGFGIIFAVVINAIVPFRIW